MIITINNPNWTDEKNRYMGSELVSILINIDGKDITIFNDNGKSIAIFEANNNNITVTWSGDNANGDIKAIIASFF